jgi:gliding motility-associated-like protein
VLIIALPSPPVPVGPTTLSYCIGGASPVLNVTVPVTEIATWYDNQTTQTTFGSTLVTPLSSSSAPGTYYYGVISYSIANGNCYSSPVLFIVNAVAAPQITTSNDTSVCRNETVSMNAAGCPTCGYVWNPPPTAGPNNTPATSTSPSASTTYTVTAVDPASGCVSNASVTVNIDQSGACFFHVYSGLTPNGDGHNDAWVIDGIDSLFGVRVTIFNRWGYEVWDGNDYDNSSVIFRGESNNGNTLPDGTYYYIITAGDVHLKGWIELSH